MMLFEVGCEKESEWKKIPKLHHHMRSSGVHV